MLRPCPSQQGQHIRTGLKAGVRSRPSHWPLVKQVGRCWSPHTLSFLFGLDPCFVPLRKVDSDAVRPA